MDRKKKHDNDCTYDLGELTIFGRVTSESFSHTCLKRVVSFTHLMGNQKW